jgi:hypothetical protein
MIFYKHKLEVNLPYFIADKGLLFETAKELLYQERMKESVRLRHNTQIPK